jgi:hypothetical protein
MSKPVSLLTERAAAQAAIDMLERGDAAEALSVLRQSLSRRKPPKKGSVDRRSESIVRLRIHIEKAIVELDHGDSAFALSTLRKTITPKPR